jgi:rRNA-processing protein FCF1
VKRRIVLPPRPVLVIDTNILLLLIGYRCSQLDEMGPQGRTRLLNEIRGNHRALPERFDHLWLFFRNAAHRIVTQHVIAEAYNLRTRALGSLRNRRDLAWEGALGILRDPGIEEQSFRVRALDEEPEYRKILVRLGPADTGLLYVAEQRKATIVSEDGELRNLALNRGIRCLTLEEISAE